jgi:heterotetrameric sarcosine oxidase gamma subunit
MLERRSAVSSSIEQAAKHHAVISAAVTLSERHPVGLLQVSAFASSIEQAQAKLSQELGLAAPLANRFSGNHTLSLRHTGPGIWQVLGLNTALPHPEMLRQVLEGLGTVVDLGHARTVFQLSGVFAARTLAKFCGMDLSESKFPTGSSTNTRFEHIGMTLSRLDDTPTFEVMVFRGYAQHVFEALVEAGAEFGLNVQVAA